MYSVELRRGRKLLKGWADVTGYQQTDIEPGSAVVEDGTMTAGIQVELFFHNKASVYVKMPEDGDKLWFMNPGTGATVRSIQYDKDSEPEHKTFRTGEQEAANG